MDMTELKGIPVSEGIVCANAYCYIPDELPEANVMAVQKEESGTEASRYREAKNRAVSELGDILMQIENRPGRKKEETGILASHIEILRDEALEEDIVDLITEGCLDAHNAIESVFDTYANLLGQVESERMRERKNDLQDVKRRLIRCLYKKTEQDLGQVPEQSVIFAKNLYPSDTVKIDPKKVVGIVTEEGSYTCHSAIIARGYGIPSVTDLPGIMDQVTDGMPVVLDAVKGSVFLQPDDQVSATYMQRQKHWEQERQRRSRFIGREGMTADGVRVEVCVNMGEASERELEAASYADGVGLFRTEFLYMGRRQAPDEEEQFKIYREVLTAYKNKRVILRTLDIGGDKQLDYLNIGAEENPFLGQRALRFCLSRPELFKTQLRAALRASIYGKLGIMFPMVGSMDDLYRAKAMLREAEEELSGQGILYSNDIQVGAMIEIPSIAVVADMLADEVDFASIGTNDLCQYMCAADRMNASVSYCYQSFHPAMLRIISHVSSVFQSAGKSLSVCGEMGGDIRAVPFLIGAGIRKLSMSQSAVAGVKEMLSLCWCKEAKELADKWMNMRTQEDILVAADHFIAGIYKRDMGGDNICTVKGQS